jgi:hypothetical protein
MTPSENVKKHPPFIVYVPLLATDPLTVILAETFIS